MWGREIKGRQKRVVHNSRLRVLILRRLDGDRPAERFARENTNRKLSGYRPDFSFWPNFDRGDTANLSSCLVNQSDLPSARARVFSLIKKFTRMRIFLLLPPSNHNRWKYEKASFLFYSISFSGRIYVLYLRFRY